jgi:hypothetical protein
VGKKHGTERKQYAVEDGKINDIGTPWRYQHGDINLVNKRAYVTHKCALDYYFGRGDISEDQHRAGITIYRDFENSHPGKSSTGSLTNLSSGVSDGSPQWMVLSAYERYNDALLAMGRISRVVISMVCIEGHRMDAVNQRLGWSVRNTGIDRLKEALDDLMEWYQRGKLQSGSLGEMRTTPK